VYVCYVFVLFTRANLIVFSCCLLVVLVWLLITVQVIDRKDTAPKCLWDC